MTRFCIRVFGGMCEGCSCGLALLAFPIFVVCAFVTMHTFPRPNGEAAAAGGNMRRPVLHCGTEQNEGGRGEASMN
jgi:hypothetical protein